MQTKEMLFSWLRGRRGGGGRDFPCSWGTLQPWRGEALLRKPHLLVHCQWLPWSSGCTLWNFTISKLHFHDWKSSNLTGSPWSRQNPFNGTPQASGGSVLRETCACFECAFTSWCKSHVPNNSDFVTTPYHHHASNGFHTKQRAW